MNPDTSLPPQLSSGDRWKMALSGFLKAFLRLLVIALVLAAVVWIGFQVAPQIYTRYILPVEENTSRLKDFQTSQAETNQQVSQSLATIQARNSLLEASNASQADTIAALQSSLAALQSTAQAGDDSAQTAIKSSTERLSALETAIGKLDTRIQSQEGAVQTLTVEMKAEDPQVTALRKELYVLKAMELITRSRLFLSESNFGLAQQDIQGAHDILLALQPKLALDQVEAASNIIQRLEFAMKNLPERPVLAADDIEIAWQLMLAGLPGQPVTLATPVLMTATPTPKTVATSAPALAAPSATAIITGTNVLTATSVATSTLILTGTPVLTSTVALTPTSSALPATLAAPTMTPARTLTSTPAATPTAKP